jgi:hypothetical protein
MKKTLKRITISVVILALLAIAANMLFVGLPLTRAINTTWSLPLNAGSNEMFVTLPAGAYLIRITEEPKLRSGGFGEFAADARISYRIMDSEDRVIFGPTSDDRSTFFIERGLEYKPIRISIQMDVEGEKPTFFSFGGTK